MKYRGEICVDSKSAKLSSQGYLNYNQTNNKTTQMSDALCLSLSCDNPVNSRPFCFGHYSDVLQLVRNINSLYYVTLLRRLLNSNYTLL